MAIGAGTVLLSTSTYTPTKQGESELSTSNAVDDSLSTTFDQGKQLLPNGADIDLMRIDLRSDEGLRTALSVLAVSPAERWVRVWDEIARILMDRAERDANAITCHRSDFIGAYLVAALETLKRRPEQLLRARRPWGVLTVIACHAGRRAVGDQVAGGLTGRDAQHRRIKHRDLPQVVSYDVLLDAGELTALEWTG